MNMNTTQSNPRKQATSTTQTSASSESILPAQPPRLGRLARMALVVLGGSFLILLSMAAFGANPAEEMAKTGAFGGVDPHGDSLDSTNAAITAASRVFGGTDPHGDSLGSIRSSLQQFAHPEFMLRLFLSLTLSVFCAWVVGWHPRRSTRLDPASDLEERKTLIILGVVGAVVAELSGTSATLAFVIFGIGALLRFRTVLDNPKVTGKAILVVVIGLACGMGSWTMAVFVTAFSWALIFWLDSRVSCTITIRINEGDGDSEIVYSTVQPLLAIHRCRLLSFAQSRGKKRMVFFVHMPTGLDMPKLEADIRAKLPKSDSIDINFDVA
jgi:hypothetical protein